MEPIQRIVMPKWGLSMSSGKVVEWLVAEGDTVNRGDELLEIETEKSAGPVEAIQEGLLRRIVAQPGEEIPVGGTLALLAPAEVPDADIDAAAEEARAQIAAGVVDEVGGPMVVTANVDGRTLSSTVVGDGDEVVVLVHGYGGDKSSWQFVQEPIATGGHAEEQVRRVYALDLPGHGSSDKDVGDGSLDTLASAVLGFLDELDDRPGPPRRPLARRRRRRRRRRRGTGQGALADAAGAGRVRVAARHRVPPRLLRRRIPS